MTTNRRRAFHRTRNLIAPKAIEEFLKRDLQDWRWIKDVPYEELLECVPDDFQFATRPRKHQLACFVIGINEPRFLMHLDMGSGKSKLILDLIRYRKWEGTLRSALIGMPNVINLASWEAQLKRHAPDLTYTVLHGTKAERYEALDEELPDVCLINYGGLPVYMANAARKTRKGKFRRMMVLEDAQDFCALFNFVAFDECHLGLSSVRSLQYDLCKQVSWAADFAYGATGTPMGRDPEKMWPQFHVIDQGETLGHSLGMFRAAFYNEKPNYWKGVEYVFDKKKKLVLNRMIQHRSIRYTDSEFSDLPKMMPPIAIEVQMSPQQLKRNQELIDAAREARINGETPGPVFIRQRQLAAGFIAMRGDDDARVEIEFTPNPKAIALEQFLIDLDPQEKLTVFHDYVPSGRIIIEVLRKLKIAHSGVGHGFKDSRAQLQRFQQDPKCRVFVANCRAGGTGVDGLQDVCRYGMFYETPTSPTTRRQSIKRLARDGQKRRVYFWDLVAQGISVDVKTHANLLKGVDVFEAVCNGKETIT